MKIVVAAVRLWNKLVQLKNSQNFKWLEAYHIENAKKLRQNNNKKNCKRSLKINN